MSEPSITLSERAVSRIAELIRSEAAPTLFRVSVEGGGCSGFQYRFDLVTETAADDFLVERDGARVVVDPVSLGFVAGAELDFVDDLIGAQFKLNNPNVTASCGCGTSFSV
ncbi:MAG: iron-sulfur cluster insertion protein ErpA [Methyloceanibacter sp.]|jgi:iron-sulfur cluster assembly accessory protein|nr:iron-sulfur cluster insertion protein ErpA [Methyloceanibacter sp.]